MAASITVSLDKDHYAPGETMTATAVYEVPPESKVSFYGSLRFLGDEIVSAPAVAVIAQVTGDDDTDRAWTKVSDNGSTAIFSATA